MKRINWPFTLTALGTVAFWAGIACLIAACGSRVSGPVAPVPSVGADLVNTGEWCIFWGVIALVLGVAGWAVLRWGAAGNIIASIIARLGGAIVPEFGAVAGGSALVLGIALEWVGQHLALVVGACILALVAWGMHRRASLVAWIRHWLHLGPFVAAKKAVSVLPAVAVGPSVTTVSK